jgi:hypothetical protein
MIGGCDIIFSTRAGSKVLEAATRALLQFWPDAVFVDAEADDTPGPYGALNFGALRQVLAYRDAEIAEEWEERGAVPELVNTMVYLLASLGDLTVVVGDRNDPEMAAYLVAVQNAVLGCKQSTEEVTAH